MELPVPLPVDTTTASPLLANWPHDVSGVRLADASTVPLRLDNRYSV